MLTCGLAFFIGRNVLMGIFTDNPDILRIGSVMLIYAAIYQFFDAVYVCYNGALRGAGDTLFPAVLTAVLCWGITVFGGRMIATFFTSVGPGGAWTIATAYGVLLGVFMYGRWARGAWRRIHLERDERRGFEVISPEVA
jgi:Na+-driven multidrug efflux pump